MYFLKNPFWIRFETIFDLAVSPYPQSFIHQNEFLLQENMFYQPEATSLSRRLPPTGFRTCFRIRYATIRTDFQRKIVRRYILTLIFPSAWARETVLVSFVNNWRECFFDMCFTSVDTYKKKQEGFVIVQATNQ